MRIYELFESNDEKPSVKAPAPRNFVAKNQKTSGAGPHTPTRFTRKEKHKKPDKVD